jgi:hypothetical protein
MGPPTPSNSSADDRFESIRLNFSSSSSECKDRSEPNTGFRAVFCSVRGRVFGLSNFAYLSDTTESSRGLVPSGIELEVEIEEGLCLLLMTSNFSVEVPSLWEAEWPKMPRLFLRRLSDIAPAACRRRNLSGRLSECAGIYLNISTDCFSESAGAIFVVSFRPGLVGRSWSEKSCIIDVHGNSSVCNYRVLDGHIL